MRFALLNLVYSLGLLIGMLFMVEVGRRIGLWRISMDKEGARAGLGTARGGDE